MLFFYNRYNITDFAFNLPLDSKTYNYKEIYKIDFFKYFWQAYLYLLKINGSETTIDKMLSAFSKKYMRFLFCGGCGQQIVVKPNGFFGPCQAYMDNTEYFKYNVLEYKRSVNEIDIFRKFAKHSSFFIPECKKCKAKTLCGGGCAYRAKFFNKPDKLMCKLAKPLFDKIIESGINGKID